jgi:thiamine-phosphate pyrophosphorylase
MQTARGIWTPRLAETLSVYVLTDRALSRGRSEAEVVSSAIAGGATAIQLRWKEPSFRDAVTVARDLKAICVEQDVLFVVNDRLDLAMAVGADAVHLGEDDLPLPEARALVGESMLLGYSPANLDEAPWAEEAGADYLGVGPVYGTQTKSDAGEAVGIERIRQVRARTTIPVVGIGGINAGNAGPVIEAGADGVAVISSVVASEDITEATRELSTAVHDAARRKRR